MNADQPKEMQTYGYDNTCLSFDPTGTLIFGYDVPANWFTTSNFESSPGTATISRQYTGKERDSESGLDYFGARYYGSALGRFTSPDEFKGGFDDLNGQAAFAAGPIPYADISDPQTLNKYVYVRNNPLRYIDPNGHCIEDLCIGEIAAAGAIASGAISGETIAAGLGFLVSNVVNALGGGGQAPGGYVPGGLTDTKGNSVFASKTNQQTQSASGQQAGPVKAADAPGVTAGGQATDVHGNKLGPSGKPQVNKTQSNSRKAADDKAKSDGAGSVEHSNPTVGKPHFHPTDADGNKKPTSTHHEYPDR